MSTCSKNRKYFVTNQSEGWMYGYNKHRELGQIANLPWLRPYLFSTVGMAREIARETGGSAFFWRGKIYENSPDDNQEI